MVSRVNGHGGLGEAGVVLAVGTGGGGILRLASLLRLRSHFEPCQIGVRTRKSPRRME